MKRLSRRRLRELSGALLAASALAGAASEVHAAPAAAGAVEPVPGEWEVRVADVVEGVGEDVVGGFWEEAEAGGAGAESPVAEAAEAAVTEAVEPGLPGEAGLAPGDTFEEDVHAAGLPHAEVARSAVPDAGAHEPVHPPAGLPDAEVPRPVVPDAEVPGGAAPDARLPDTEVPETVVPDSRLPDTGTPDAALPDADADASDTPAAGLPGTEAPEPAPPAPEAPEAPDTGTNEDGDGFEPPDRRTPASAYDFDFDADAGRGAEQLSHTGADFWFPLGAGVGSLGALGAGAVVVARKRRNA
jgi:hypothetical protein